MTTVAEKTKYRFVPPYSVIAKASFALVYSLWFSAARLPFKEAVALLRIFRAVQGGGQSWPSRNHRTCRRCACRLGFHVLRVRTPPHPAAAAMVLPTRRSGPAIRCASRRPSKSPSSPLACSGVARGARPLDDVAHAHLVEHSGRVGAGRTAASVHGQRDRARGPSVVPTGGNVTFMDGEVCLGTAPAGRRQGQPDELAICRRRANGNGVVQRRRCGSGGQHVAGTKLAGEQRRQRRRWRCTVCDALLRFQFGRREPNGHCRGRPA